MMVPKSRNKKQNKDDKTKNDKDVNIAAVGMVDKHGGKIIELVTDSDGDYDWLK